MRRLLTVCGRAVTYSRWDALAVLLLLLYPIEPDASASSSLDLSVVEQQVSQVPDDLSFANGLYQDRRYDLAVEEYSKFLKSTVTGPFADDARYGLANSYLFLGKYKEAHSAFELFLEKAPTHPNAATALFRVGETAYLLGDLASAKSSLERFTSCFPTHRHAVTAWSHLGDIYYRSAEYPQARNAYQAVLKSASGSLSNRSRLGLAKVFSSKREFAEALQELAELSRTGGPEWVDKAWFETGRIQMELGRFDAAVTAFETLEKVAPKSSLGADSRLLRAESLGRLNRVEDAEAVLATLIESKSPLIVASAFDSLGLLKMSRGAFEDALKCFENGLFTPGKTPQSPALSFHAAEAEHSLGKKNEAKARFLKLWKEYPKDPLAESALLRAATIALDFRDYDQARDLVTNFLRGNSNSPLVADARLIEGRALLGKGKSKEAIQVLSESLNSSGSRSAATSQAARYYLGLAYRSDGQAAKASEVLEALAKVPESQVSVDAQFLLGQGYIEGGKFSEAIPVLEGYLRQRPNGEVSDYALAHLVHAYIELGRTKDALGSLDQIRKRFPSSKALATANLRVAESFFSSKDFAQAVEFYKSALTTDQVPIRRRAFSGLGWAYLQANQPQESVAAFDRVIELDSKDATAADAAYGRGRALQRDGKTVEACEAYANVAKAYSTASVAGPALLAQGRLLIEAKKPSEAAKVFEQLSHRYPQEAGEPLVDLLAEWGWALVDSGQTKQADVVFTRILNEFPDSPRTSEARFNLAESAYFEKRFGAIPELLEEVIATGSKASTQLIQSSLYRLGRAQLELKSWAAASATFTRLLKDFPDGTYRREAEFWHAEVAFQSGDIKAAIKELSSLASQPASSSEPAGLRGTIQRRLVQGLLQLDQWIDVLKAADEFKSNFANDPQAPDVDYARGRALQGLARFDEARSAFDEVIKARRGTELAAKAQFMRGECYFHQKTYREALKEYLRVDYMYDAPTWQALALLEAGKVHEQLTQWAEAAETYERLRSKFPSDPSSAKAQTRLDAVRKRIAAAPEAGDRVTTGP